MVANPCLSGGALELFLEPHLPPPRVAVAGESPVARALRRAGRAARLRGAARRRRAGRATSRPSSPRSGTTTRTRCAAGSRPAASTSGSSPRGGEARRCSTRCAAAGVPEEALARVRTPAGLDIGARTHAEIALAILAELVAVRRARPSAGRPPGAVASASRPARGASTPSCGMTVAVGPGDDARPRGARRSAARAAGRRGSPVPAEPFVSGLVLAAGGSSRLGRPKQLLPYRGATLLDAVLGDGARVRVRPAARRARRRGRRGARRASTCAGADVVVNHAFGTGCSSSIAAAMGALDPRCDVLVLLLGDQPGVTPATVGALLAGRGDAPLAVCRYDDGARPPVRVRARGVRRPRARCTATRRCGSCSTGARATWRRCAIAGPVPLDVDTWEDYEAVAGRRGGAVTRAARRGAPRRSRSCSRTPRRSPRGSTRVGLPRRRRARHGDVPLAAAAAAAAARGRGGRGQDRGGAGARRGARHAADPPAVLRGDGQLRGAVRVELPAPAAADPARGGRRRRTLARGRPVRPRRTSCAGRCSQAIEHPGPLPAVLLVDELDRADHDFEAFLLEVLADAAVTIPELGHDPRDGAARRGPDVEPHARPARRAQAPLPVPLDRLPGRRRARSRSCAGACRARRAALAADVVGGARAAARGRRAEAAGHRRGDRLGRGARAARRRAARRGGRGPHARRGAEVPRGPGAGRARPGSSAACGARREWRRPAWRRDARARLATRPSRAVALGRGAARRRAARDARPRRRTFAAAARARATPRRATSSTGRRGSSFVAGARPGRRASTPCSRAVVDGARGSGRRVARRPARRHRRRRAAAATAAGRGGAPAAARGGAAARARRGAGGAERARVAAGAARQRRRAARATCASTRSTTPSSRVRRRIWSAGWRSATPPRRARRARTVARAASTSTCARRCAAAGAPAAIPSSGCTGAAASGRAALVALLDVSGSMAPYARAYLLLLEGAARGARAETFVFATRLTRVTRALREGRARSSRSSARAPRRPTGPAARGSARRCARSTTATAAAAWPATPSSSILSDGWERGDPALVGREMERLARLAYRIVWVNPRVAAPGFAPAHRRAWPRRCRTSTSCVSGHSARGARRASSRRSAGTDREEDAMRFENQFDVDAPIERGLGRRCSTSSASRRPCRAPRCSSRPATTPTRSRSRSRSARCR